MPYASKWKNASTGDALRPVPYIPVGMLWFGVSPSDLEYLYGGTWSLYNPRICTCWI